MVRSEHKCATFSSKLSPNKYKFPANYKLYALSCHLLQLLLQKIYFSKKEYICFVDVCGEWLSCASKPMPLLSTLPACPCSYPVSLHHKSSIYDQKHKRKFDWQDTSAPQFKNHVYRPGATLCIRSKPLLPTNMAAQQCCYDNDLRLITRGQAAGTPMIVSPEVSYDIHFQLDVMPWIMCGGDWTR